MKIGFNEENGYVLPSNARKILSPLNDDMVEIHNMTFDVSSMSWRDKLLLLSAYEQLLTKSHEIKKILIVDDDEISRDIMRDAIADFCHRYDKFVDIREISYAEDAWQVLQEENDIDLILLDINFGEGRMTGIELLKKIRERECELGISSVDGDIIQTSKLSTKVALISGINTEENHTYALQYGATFIPKMSSVLPYTDSILTTIFM